MEVKKDIQQIDFTQIAKRLWIHRKIYYYVLPATLIITYLLTVCMPRYYKCTVSLAPEPSGPSMSGSLSSLASSFGIGNLAKMASQDAISSDIYPNVIASKNFIAELLTTEVTTKDDNTKCTYYVYLRDKQKSAWWSQVTGAISNWIKPSKKDLYNGEEKLSIFNLTKQQEDIFAAVNGNVTCDVDKKTDVVSITMKDQDPLVCATMADVTCQKLQAFIIKYRTNKARIDYEYYKKLREESRAEYDKARQAYADYADAHQNVTLINYTAKTEDLENEMQLKHNIYTAMNTQMQAAMAKLQEATPAFTVIESASIPIRPAGPKRMIISIAMMILSFFVLSGWLLFKYKQ